MAMPLIVIEAMAESSGGSALPPLFIGSQPVLDGKPGHRDENFLGPAEMTVRCGAGGAKAGRGEGRVCPLCQISTLWYARQNGKIPTLQR
jgi:hypothetical protein